MKREIMVSKGISDLIEQLHYETNSLKDLILFLIKNNLSLQDNNYKYIYEEYKLKNMEFLLAKNELEKIYNIPMGTKWTLTTEGILNYEVDDNV